MKTAKKLLSILLAVMMIVSIIPLTSVEAEAAGNVKSKLDSFISSYPSGSRWTGSFDGGIQCYGFGKMVIYNIFGKASSGSYRTWTYSASSTTGMEVIGSITNFSSSNVKSLLSKAKCGDVLQFNTTKQHTMIVYSVDSSGVTIYDCNWDNNCGISKRYCSFGTWSNRNSTKLTLLRADNYNTVDGAETHKVDSNYGKNFTAYPKAKITANNIFDENHNQISSSAWIGTSDKCTIHEVYTDGCCKVSYPLDSGGTKTVYSKISLFSTHTHSYTSKVTKAATCTSNGVKTYTCSCGKSYTETIKALGHSYTGEKVHEGTHPHEISQRCVRYASCGGYIWTGENAVIASCSSCRTENPKKIYASTSSVSLKLGGTESTTVYAWTEGIHNNPCVLSWQTSNSNVSCSWGEWNDAGKLPLTITAKAKGTTVITLSVKDKNTDTVLHSVKINVNVDAKTYAVSYNANGGTGAPSSQTKIHGTNLTLSSTKPTRTGYTFLGWSTSSTATSATYSAGGSFATNANTTLYAVWKANTYTVKYNANGGSGSMSNSSHTYDVSKALTSNAFTRAGYKFLGWSTSSTATTATYTDKQSVKNLTATNGDTVTLYAVWQKNPVTLSSVSVSSLPDKTEYIVGDTFDASGLALKVTLSDGSTKTITTGYAVSVPDMLTTGTKTVTVTYKEKTTTFTITVKEAETNAPSIKVESASVVTGQQVTVPVVVENIDLGVLTINIKYDSAKLKLSSIDGIPFDMYETNTSTDGEIRITAFDNTSVSAGTVANITFDVIAESTGNTNINVSVEEAFDGNDNAVELKVYNGTVEIITALKGDVNLDGKVTAIDARWALQNAAGNRELTDEQKAAGDVNGDGKVSAIDARWILQAVAGNRVL